MSNQQKSNAKKKITTYNFTSDILLIVIIAELLFNKTYTYLYWIYRALSRLSKGLKL